MTKAGISGTLLLGAVFAGALLYYSFYQPFLPGAVQRAIPPESSFVYLAESLEDLLQSPVSAELDKSLGAGNSLRELLHNNAWKNLAGASEIAITDIPYQQAGQRKSWAAVSWVGWRSPWLRWKLEHAADERLRFLGKHAVWPIWQYDAPDLARGLKLTVSLTDNVFVACLSERSSDIVLLLNAYDRSTPSERNRL
jgi:hypothetical protein